MSSKLKTIDDAVDTMAAIASVEVDRTHSLSRTQPPRVPVEIKKVERTIEWLKTHDLTEAVSLARGVFNVVHGYIKKTIAKEGSARTFGKVDEKVQSIMSIISQGALNLEKIAGTLYHAEGNVITELDEYKQLQKFYRHCTTTKVDAGQISQWIFGLATASQTSGKNLADRISLKTEYVFVDLESVQRDTEYELFFLKKDDGGRFFNPKLIRSMSLACDFDEILERSFQQDPIEDIYQWHDKRMRSSAASIVDYIQPMLPLFFKNAAHHKNRELPGVIQKAVMALMMSRNEQNYYHDRDTKSGIDYFSDFLFFLRAALCCKEYQKILSKPETSNTLLEQILRNLLHAMCYALFTQAQGDRQLVYLIQEIIQSAVESMTHEGKWKDKTVCDVLKRDYIALKKGMQGHFHGHLMKLIEVLETGENSSFDPLWQYSIPCHLYSLYRGESYLPVIRMPSPTHQVSVGEVVIDEEFRGFIQAMRDSSLPQHHLIINFQDRTSWREYARASAIEGIQFLPECQGVVTVATLAKDTEFYWQQELYSNDNHADVFIQNFKDQVQDDGCGFFFPGEIRKEMNDKFFHQLLEAVHVVFFGNKNVLTDKERCAFIEICYLFMEMKVVDIVKPHSMSFLCKDGADVSAPANTLVFLFFKLLQQEGLTLSDETEANVMLYAQPLALRERILMRARFDRMLYALKQIEHVRAEHGYDGFRKIIEQQFGHFYKIPILKWTTMTIN